MAERPPIPGDASYSSRPTRKRRRMSVWTLLAPAGALALFVVFFVALGNSCLSDGCTKSGDDEDKKAGPANDLPAGARAQVKAGDSMGSIADKYKIKLDDLKACNPNVDPVAIQPGQFLVVSAASCEGKDLAAVGANPDPLAGETSAPPKESAKPNATAAADPSAAGIPEAGDAADKAAAAKAAGTAGTDTKSTTDAAGAADGQ